MSTIKHVLSTPAYFVRRNTRGSLPVYTDVRNTHIRNVEGSVDSLAQDIKQSLSDNSLSVKVKHQRHIILSGRRFKRDVLAWLTAKGF